MAPLLDAKGSLRYFIGAQIDVSALLESSAALPSLSRLQELQSSGQDPPDHRSPCLDKDEALRRLGESLNSDESSILHKTSSECYDQSNFEGVCHMKPRNSNMPHSFHAVIQEPGLEALADDRLSENLEDGESMPTCPPLSGKLSGVFQHYLLIRPYPSLRILFASPSQRIPGILQSSFMDRIGGTDRVRNEITAAFAAGRAVTAKVRWRTKSDQNGRSRWIHCTPLIGLGRQIGVWMIVIVADESARSQNESEQTVESQIVSRRAPPIMNGAIGAALHGLTTSDILPFETSSEKFRKPPTTLPFSQVESNSSQADMPRRVHNVDWKVSRDFADKLVIGDSGDHLEHLRQKSSRNFSSADFAYPAENGSLSSFSF
jgi:hypothetical protein